MTSITMTLLLLAVLLLAACIGCLHLSDLLDDMRKRKDAAYAERNEVVALLASIYPSGIGETSIENWDSEWHGCVYIDLPFAGQVSWHFHDSQKPLFAMLPPYFKAWDGHSTEQKYRRVSDQRVRNLLVGDRA